MKISSRLKTSKTKMPTRRCGFDVGRKNSTVTRERNLSPIFTAPEKSQFRFSSPIARSPGMFIWVNMPIAVAMGRGLGENLARVQGREVTDEADEWVDVVFLNGAAGRTESFAKREGSHAHWVVSFRRGRRRQARRGAPTPSLVFCALSLEVVRPLDSPSLAPKL